MSNYNLIDNIIYKNITSNRRSKLHYFNITYLHKQIKYYTHLHLLNTEYSA